MSTTVVHVTTTDISLALLLGHQLEGFAAAGYEVIGASAPGPWAARLDAAGIRHVPLAHATRAWAPVEDVRALIELWRLFRRLRPDIVHTHNPKPGIYGRLAAQLARVPVIVNTVHGLYAQPGDRPARRLPVYALERLAAACSDAELVQGREDLETLASIGVPRGKLTLLGNGIDLARFDPDAVSGEERDAVRAGIGADDDTVVCGVVGRLVREKGIDEVLAAARLLRTEAPSARFAIIGIADADKADAVAQESLAAAERESGVVVLGQRDDMPACYAAMDLLVFPSHREGFPRAPMEAAAMGRPVVASDVRGCREVVDDGVTGVLVPVRSPEALASAVASLVEDPGRRAAMGAAGREKALRCFDDRAVVTTTLTTYQRLLRRKRPTHGELLGQPSPGAVIRYGRVDDARRAAELHRDALPKSFLAHLGVPFLALLYRRAVLDRGSFLLVAEVDGDGVVGAVMATERVAGLYRRFVLRDGIRAALAAAPTLLRRWRDVLDLLRYPSGSGAELSELPEAELLALAVSQRARGMGVGRALGQEVVREYQRRGVDRARLIVGDDNDAATAVYRNAGFRRVGDAEVHTGSVQGVWVWP